MAEERRWCLNVNKRQRATSLEVQVSPFFPLPIKCIRTRAERRLDSIGITRMTDNVLSTPEEEEMGRFLEESSVGVCFVGCITICPTEIPNIKPLVVEFLKWVLLINMRNSAELVISIKRDWTQTKSYTN